MKAIDAESLTPLVEALFSAATEAFEVPSRDACRVFANALVLVKSRPHDKKRLKPAKDAHSAAGALLRRLLPIRQKLAVSVSDNEAMGGHAAHFNEELEQIDAAVKAVEALLPALDRPPIKPWLGNDQIRFIADQAQQAWASTNDIPPVSKGSEDPLARLVTGALDLVDIGWSTNTVADVLKRRRRA
jgi:hypothetical protein